MVQEILDCGKLLINKKLSLAFAESATAGFLSGQFSLVPKAGNFLKGGLACYDAELKKNLLCVPEGLIDKLTPESMEVTIAMCSGLAELIPADFHVAVTGLTGPGGSETEEKPVGTMFMVGFLHGEQQFAERMCFAGNAEQVISSTLLHVARLIINTINSFP